MKCAICGKEIESKFGNNPYPVRTDEDARCCDKCNEAFVIPSRISLMYTPRNKHELIVNTLNITSHEDLIEIFC